MKIIVKVKTRAKVESIERVGQDGFALKGINNDLPIYKISVKEAPVAGRANEAIIKLLADYFKIAPARIQLLSGQTSKQKVFEVV
ncbi:MAG: DUF167 domain-containing protein [Candidatus Paceibacterota bacterium]